MSEEKRKGPTADALLQQWLRVAAQQRKFQAPELPFEDGAFKSTAWDSFEPATNLRILVDPRSSYRGHKEVLFAGVAAWCIAPKDQKFVQRAIRLATAKVVRRIERAASSITDRPDLFALFLANSLQWIYFYESIYFPMGGMAALLVAPSKSSMRRLSRTKSTGIGNAVWILRIYHCHFEHLANDLEYRRPSLLKASEIANKLHVGRALPGRRMMQAHWADHRSSIALLYAASTIQTNNGTLLQALEAGQATYREHGGFLEDWIGRARWICNEVLSRCVEKMTANENLAHLPSVPSIAIESAGMSDNQVEDIKKAFRRGRRNL